MVDEIRYFGYQLPNGGAMFIGTDRGQIARTLDHYRASGKLKNPTSGEDIKMPAESEFLELEGDVNITCAFGLANVNHNIDARVRPRVVFHINANAFDYVRAVGRDYSARKRGDLYKFQTQPVLGLLWFLPEDVMQGLRDYDWNQHTAQVDQWLGVREGVIEEGKRLGILGTPKPKN